MIKRVTYTLSMNPEVAQRLDNIVRIYGTNRSQVLTALIEAEADRLEGNPKIEEFMKKLGELKEMLGTPVK